MIDIEELGKEEIKTIIENQDYISARNLKIETADIGKWSDAHPLNYQNGDFESYFKKEQG